MAVMARAPHGKARAEGEAKAELCQDEATLLQECSLLPTAVTEGPWGRRGALEGAAEELSREAGGGEQNSLLSASWQQEPVKANENDRLVQGCP